MMNKDAELQYCKEIIDLQRKIISLLMEERQIDIKPFAIAKAEPVRHTVTFKKQSGKDIDNLTTSVLEKYLKGE